MKPMSYLAFIVGLAGLAATATASQELRPQSRPDDLAVVAPDAAAPQAPNAAAPQAPNAAAPQVPNAAAPQGPVAAAPQVTEPPATQTIAARPEPAADPTLGPETNLPLPRYVSLKTDEGNVRRGPSMSHRIDWVFRREDMPLQIIAEYGHWRRVVDSDGVGGWMNYAMLSGNRTVLVQTDMQPIYSSPDAEAPQNAILALGVVAELGTCQPDWCWISTGGYRGWAPKSALWGVDAGEVRD